MRDGGPQTDKGITGESRKRRATEVALGAARETFQLLVESVRDYAIFALDPDGFIVTWNKGAERLKGYKAEEILGKHFSQFYTHADIARNHPAEELEYAKVHGKYEEESWRIRKDGSRFWAHVLITTLWDDTGALRGFAKVTRDLTERKEAEETLRQANEELERRVVNRTRELTNAMSELESAVRARDEFMSIASHELKTPLTVLRLQAQIRARELRKPGFTGYSAEKLGKMLSEDEQQIRRLTRLVDDMLDISRISAGKFVLEREPMDLTAMIKQLCERFHAQAEALGTTLTLKAPCAVRGIWDRYRLEQVLSNLLSNALKYGDRKPIEVTVGEGAGKALFSVRDQGLGIAREDKERIFQQFERAVPASRISGMGLGLYIAQQIVHAHKGAIHLESALGQGSTFIVELPFDSR